jgi:hypothetical protein
MKWGLIHKMYIFSKHVNKYNKTINNFFFVKYDVISTMVRHKLVVMGKKWNFFWKKSPWLCLCGVKKALEATSWLHLMRLFISGMSHSSKHSYPTTHAIHITRRVFVFHDEILLWLQSIPPRSSPKMLCELNGTFVHSHAKPSSKKPQKKKKRLSYFTLPKASSSELPLIFRPTSLGYRPKIRGGYKENTFPLYLFWKKLKVRYTFPLYLFWKKLKALPRGRRENGERKDISFVLFLNVNFIKAKAHKTSWHSAHREITDGTWEWRRRRRKRRVHNVT